MAAVIRPRRPWEAFDLGFGMVRAWWKPVYAAWFAVTFPVWLAISVGLYRWPVWSILAFWWLKPLYDRVPLFVLSRALFGATPTLRQTLRSVPRLWIGHLLSALTLYRLDVARSFNLPVWQLEGLRGSARWNRARVLQRDTHGPASWLTVACLFMEQGAALATLGFLSLLIPNLSLGEVFDATGGSGFWPSLARSTVFYLGVSLMEPFYVASGFSLYLSRRTHLEGWDVELAFRRMASRLREEEPAAAPVRRHAALLLAALVGLGALLIPSAAARAQDALAETAATKAVDKAQSAVQAAPTVPPEKAIREVLSQSDLQTKKKVTRWRFKGTWPKWNWKLPSSSRSSKSPSFPFLRPLAYGLAILGGIALLIILIRWGIRQNVMINSRNRMSVIPETIFGLDIRPESLPADIPGAAWALWEKGERALALGLLYRGALASLVRRDGVPVRASWTEGDCLRFVAEKTGGPRADYFTRLTRAWQSAAYAHRPPDGSVAQSLCSSWNQHFGEAA